MLILIPQLSQTRSHLISCQLQCKSQPIREVILCLYDEVDDYLMSRTIQLQHESANEANDVGSPERPILRREPDGNFLALVEL